MWNVNRFLFSLGLALSSSGIFVASVNSQDRHILCTKFPLNSRCQDGTNKSQLNPVSYSEYQLDRDAFCAEFSLNDRCQKEPVEIINFNLQDEEWIRIKKSGNKIELAHSERTKDGLVSLATDGILDLIPLPDLIDDYSPFGVDDVLPIDLNRYVWEDHQIIQIGFRQDNCPADNCLILGKNTIDLPQATNFSDGIFTVEYQEQEFKRSVTFRIPEDIAVKIEKKIIIRIPNGTAHE